jgi:hypothetical protein
MLPAARLLELTTRGWRLSRDGSTATASRMWTDPEDEESGWQIQVLHTAGHGARFSLSAEGWGLTERSPAEGAALLAALEEAYELLADWSGETPEAEP